MVYWSKGTRKARDRIHKINKKSLLLVRILLWWKRIKKQWQSSTASVAEHTLMVLIINHLVIPGLRVIMRNHSNAISLILHLLIYLFLSRARLVVCSYTQNMDFCPKIAKQLFQSVSNWTAAVSNCYWESWLHLLILLERDTTGQVLEPFPQSYLTQSLVWVNHITVYTLRLANEWRKQI